MRCTDQRHKLALGRGVVGALARSFHGHDGFRIAVDHQRGHRQLFQVVAKIGACERVQSRQRHMLSGLLAECDRRAALRCDSVT